MELLNRKELHAVLATVLPGPPSTQPSRPGPAGRGEQATDEEQLVLVHRAAGDPAALAPGTRPEEVVLSEDWPARTAADRTRRPRPHRPPGQGEPALGLSADPRGAPQARDQGLCDDGPDDPASPRPGSCATPGRPKLDPVPTVPGGGDLGDRLLHRRDDQPQDALRPVLHRALDAARAPRRRHREPRLRLGYPAGAEPRHRGAAVGCPVPRARPRR